jgi:hypothetical protein
MTSTRAMGAALPTAGRRAPCECGPGGRPALMPLGGWALAALLMTGCVVMPVPGEKGRAPLPPVPEGKAHVYVFEAGGAVVSANYTIFANAERIGDISRNDFLAVECDPGPVDLSVARGRGAARLQVAAVAGRRHFLQIVPTRSAVVPLPVGPVLVTASVSSVALELATEQEGTAKVGEASGFVRLRSHAAEDEVARARRAPADAALVFVARPLWTFADVDFRVTIDGQPMGKLAARSFAVAMARPGAHALQARGDNDSDVDLVLQVEGGREYFFLLLPQKGFWSPQVELAPLEEIQGRERLQGLRFVKAESR